MQLERAVFISCERLIPGKSKKRSDRAAPSKGQGLEMELVGMLSRYFNIYSSRFDEELHPDWKLPTYLGITCIESHREIVKLSPSLPPFDSLVSCVGSLPSSH